MKLLTGTSNIPLASSIAEYLKISLIFADVKRFADGEINVRIQDDIVGEDVYIIQSLAPLVNEYLMELFILSNVLREMGAREITAMIPYYAYARQDKDNQNLAFFFATLLKASGVDRIITLDLHNPDICKFFPVKMDALKATSLFAHDIQTRFEDELITIVSPDEGGSERARCLAEQLGTEYIILRKIRVNGDVCVFNKETNVKGKICLIVDDIVDSGATLMGAAEVLKRAGAREIHAYITHAVLSGNAVEKIKLAKIDSLTVSDSIKKDWGGARLLSTAELLSKAITCKL